MTLLTFWRKRPLIEELALNVARLYQAVDRDAANFSRKSGLKCPAGCGHCCENAKITSSALEFLPLACELWKRGKSEEWIGRISADTTPLKCVFYEKFTGGEGKGHCRIYAWRPLVCRVFGFSSVRDKMGKHIYAACSVLKKGYSEKVEKAMNMTIGRSAPPVITKFSGALSGIDPYLSMDQISIGEAAVVALEKVVLLCHIAAKIKRPLPSGGA